jgi:RNA polymerase sigma factor (sigma-70 family)
MRRHDAMANDAVADQERMRRFRDAALPHLDDLYTLARYLMRNATDAEDAVQECYLRALRHFDSYRGPAMKPWLLAILRNVCKAEFARRGKDEVPTDFAQDESLAEDMPMWQEPQASPEKLILRQQDSATIRRLVAELPELRRIRSSAPRADRRRARCRTCPRSGGAYRDLFGLCGEAGLISHHARGHEQRRIERNRAGPSAHAN